MISLQRPAHRCRREVGDTCRRAHRQGGLWPPGPRSARFVDPDATFVVDDPDAVPPEATPFDMRGVELGHQGGDCSFETILHLYDLTDPVLWQLAAIVHEADLEDERFDAPEGSRSRRRAARSDR